MLLADGAAQKLVSHPRAKVVPATTCSNVHASRPTNQDEEPDETLCDAKKYNQLQSVTNQDLLDSYQKFRAIGMPFAPRKNVHSGSRPVGLAIPCMH